MASDDLCTHLSAISRTVTHARKYECEECVKIPRPLAAPAHLSELRRDALLRQLAEQARHQARPRHHPPR